jgi:ATP-dependent RNA helicase DeaD
VGRERNADPKWLLPEICRQGEVSKKDVGAIRIFDMETLFQISVDAAPKFTTLVSERKKGGVRISPALDQSGETTARPHEARPREEKPRERLTQSEVPGESPPRKPGFQGKKFADGKKKFGGGKKKFGKPGHKNKAPKPA